MKYLKDYQDGDKICGIYLVNSVAKGVTVTGSKYLNIMLQDCTALMEARKWDASDNSIDNFQQDSFVFIQGDVLKYKNSLQIKINEERSVDWQSEGINLDDYLPSAPLKKEEMMNQLESYIELICDEEIKDLTRFFINKYRDRLGVIPAGMKIHHAYIGGLLHHILTMLHLATAICAIYPYLDRDLLISGVIFHDLGKIQELVGDINVRYSTSGRLLGHISIFHAELHQEGCNKGIDKEKLLVLEHLVLSHHRKMEHGSPVEPMIPEANVLSLIDALDSEMSAIEKILANINENEFSNRIFYLNERAFYRRKK